MIASRLISETPDSRLEPKQLRTSVIQTITNMDVESETRQRLLNLVPNIAVFTKFNKKLLRKKDSVRFASGLEKICKSHCGPQRPIDGERFECPQGDWHTPFILSDRFIKYSDTTVTDVVLTVTTYAMLKKLSEAAVIAVDGTYNITRQRVTLIVVTAISPSKVAHSGAFSIVLQETTEVYKELFLQLGEAIRAYLGREFSPKIVMADGAKSITRGIFESIRGDFVRANCFFHLLQAVKKQCLGAFRLGKKIWKSMKKDLSILG